MKISVTYISRCIRPYCASLNIRSKPVMRRNRLPVCVVKWPGDPVATMILLGLGLDEFSMSASAIPVVKNIVRSVTVEECKAVAEKALTMSTASEIVAYAKSILAEKGL